jgi:hypothetical protein
MIHNPSIRASHARHRISIHRGGFGPLHKPHNVLVVALATVVMISVDETGEDPFGVKVPGEKEQLEPGAIPDVQASATAWLKPKRGVSTMVYLAEDPATTVFRSGVTESE